MFFVLFVCCHASDAARCCLLFHPLPCAGGGGCGRRRQCHRPGACDSLLSGRGCEAFDRPRQRCESFDAREPWQFVLTSRDRAWSRHITPNKINKVHGPKEPLLEKQLKTDGQNLTHWTFEHHVEHHIEYQVDSETSRICFDCLDVWLQKKTHPCTLGFDPSNLFTTQEMCKGFFPVSAFDLGFVCITWFDNRVLDMFKCADFACLLICLKQFEAMKS